MDDYNEVPPPPNRVLEVELNGSEIITIELDTLDADPRDYIDLLIEGNVRASVWARLACEYWKKGLLDAAVMCANDALRRESFLSFLPISANYISFSLYTLPFVI